MNIWNVLHDGEIIEIKRFSENKISLFISIPYLRKRIQPVGDGFVLKINGVKRIEHVDYNANIENIEDLIKRCKLEIVKCISIEMPYIIETTLSKMIIDYENMIIELDTGNVIDKIDIEKISTEYWDEWKIKWEKKF